MPKRFHGERVLNPLRRRIFRRYVSPWELGASGALLALLALSAVWVLAQRENYDPAARDVSLEALRKGSVADTLYHQPLRPWVEPGRAVAAAGPDLGLFPPALLEGGWSLRGRVETYDPSNLYEKINGAAEQYLTYGFRRLHYLTLEEGERSLTLEVYDQERFRNALGLFASQRDESRSIENRGGVHYYPTSVGAIGIRGPYLFKIAGSESSDAVASKTGQLLDMVAGLPAPADGGSRIFDLLTGPLGVPFEGVAYEKQDVFQYEFLGDVWFGRAGRDSDARYFLHRAPDASTAASEYEQLAEEHGYEYEVVAEEDGETLFRHEFLETYFGVARRDDWLYGVDGAPDDGTARALLSRLHEALNG